MMSAAALIRERAGQVRAAPDDDDVPSPCLSICRMEAATGWCEGCLRTLDEIAAWGRLDAASKRALWAVIEERLVLRTGRDA
jgi:predicted Fe-S protein YdhL (DUF1289 family)